MNFIQSAFMFIFALVVYLYHKTMMQEAQNINSASERKIELKSNYESEAGKNMQIWNDFILFCYCVGYLP